MARSSFSHDAICPEVSPKHCADPAVDVPDHEHHQSVTLTRFQGAISYGLGNGWQVQGKVPVDVKFLAIDYTMPDGSSYQPPYGGIHHRNEVLFGLGDGRLEIQNFHRLTNGWVIGAGFGSTLPLGRTEEDPYRLAAQSSKHQHIQMGAGIFKPTFSASAVWSGHVWGMTTFINGELAMYANNKEFRPPSRINVAVGPTYRVTPKLMLTSELSLSHESQAEWHAEPDPQSGLTRGMIGASAIYRFNPMLAVMLQANTSIFQWTQEAVIRQPFVGSVGLSWTPKGKSQDDETR